MKTIYDFEQKTPPALTEEMLRAELEHRAKKRQSVLLALVSILFQIAALLFACLTAEAYPIITLICICHVIVSVAGSSAIAVVYTQKEGLYDEQQY